MLNIRNDSFNSFQVLFSVLPIGIIFQFEQNWVIINTASMSTEISDRLLQSSQLRNLNVC